MVDSYWRKIDEMKNDIENAMQMSSILLKLKEHDNKINDINTTDISSKTKIDTNEKDISFNLKKIDTNIKDISSNKTNILNNEKKINKNENIKKRIYYDKIHFKYFSNIGKRYVKIVDINIDFPFINNYIKINSSFHSSLVHTNINFNNIYKFYNDKNELFKEVKLNHKDSYDDITKFIFNNFEIKSDNSQNVKLEVYLENIMDNNENVSFYQNKNSYIEIKIYKYIEVFNILDENISNNSKEINLIKENTLTNKQYLKNIYNELFYNEKTQIDFNNPFYEKLFDVDAKENDFIEIDFKISLECDSISLINYIKVTYEILDKNNNSLYIKSAALNQYKYFGKYIFVDENIFYNSNKNIKSIKFIIRFEQVKTRIIFMYYLKNDNYRFILKHYGL